MFQSRKQDVDIVSELSVLLRRTGDKILSGESKLSLTTQSLSRLNVSFRRYSDTSHQGETTGDGRRGRDRRQEEQLQRWRTNVQFLNDFISKTVSLKLTHGAQTMQEPVFLTRFRNVEVLELKKIPVHMLHGLQKLRGQLKVLIVSRCLQNLEDLIETCGGDLSAPLSWPQLTSLYVSCNGLVRLDNSFRLLPALEVLDLGHNQLHKTESFLETLSEIIRVNLGYNCLDSLPSFSASAKPKIRTLILRNNNLDNIEGIEELLCIEELDVSSNCLVDHSCLSVLSGLSKLCRICLQGNPLSFHRSHRALTLQHVASTAGRNMFTLDGKLISPTERLLTQRSGLSASRRPSQEAHTIIASVGQSGANQRIQQAYMFDDSDNIATSLKVGLPANRKGRRRSKVKNRLSYDDRLLDVSTDGDSSRENSRVGSPVRVIEDKSSIREEVEVLRDHYGVNWLQVISANKAAARENKQSGLRVHTVEAKKRQPIVSGAGSISKKSNVVIETEDDIYLNDSDAGLLENHFDGSGSHSNRYGASRNSDPDGASCRHSDDDIEVLTSENEESTVIQREVSSGEIYSKTIDSPYRDEELLVKREDSSHGAEWQRMEEDQEQYYGSESDPYIVTLANSGDTQLIVTVNQRYIIEKDLNGRVVEMLDLKCLEHISLSQGASSQEGQGEITLPTLRMRFDYVRKDRRERSYLMEDDENAESFQGLLQPCLDAKELDRKLEGLLQCLKCSAQFDKSEAEPAHISLLQTLSKNSSVPDVAVKYRCPKCNSQMVVQMETRDKPPSRQTTPIGSYSSVSSLQNIMAGTVNKKTTSTKSRSPVKIGRGSPPGMDSTTKPGSVKIDSDLHFDGDRSEAILSGSPVAKSTPLKDESTECRVSLSGPRYNDYQPEEIKPEYPLPSFVIMSRSDGFSHMNTDEKVNCMSKSSSNVIGQCVTTPTENKAFQRNHSWSDVNKALSHRPLKHRASVDSDITILTNTSDSSVAVISESSIETIPDPKVKVTDLGEGQSQMECVFNQNLPLPLSSNNSLTTGGAQGVGSVHTNKKVNLNGIAEEQGEITPIGSPLSTSICSSMVSSVYENSLVTASEEDLNALVEDSKNVINHKAMLVTEDNNNGDNDVGIYDNSYTNDSIYDNNVENEHRTSSTQDTSDEVDNIAKEFHSAVTLDVESEAMANTSDQENIEEGQITLEINNGIQMETSVAEGESSGSVIGMVSSEELDFTVVDHRLKLYLMMHVLEDKDECQCAMECDVTQYLSPEAIKGVVVFTSSKIIILKILSEYTSESLDESLSCIENQPITELQYIDIGLGYQTLRFEFDTECSSYTFHIRDEKRCKTFISLITGIVQSTAFSHGSRLEGISKYNATTLDNLRTAIAGGDLEEGEITDGDDGYILVRYLSCHHVMDSDEEDQRMVGLVITATELCMLGENHQWPVPRLQAPLNEEIKGQQFMLLEKQRINNIASVEMCETDHTQIRFTFFSEDSEEETCWLLNFTTTDSVQSLVGAIREPWESEFGVALDITPVSFTED